VQAPDKYGAYYEDDIILEVFNIDNSGVVDFSNPVEVSTISVDTTPGSMELIN
jgi:hypothetical protein